MERVKFWDDIAEKYASKPIEDVEAYQRKLDLTKAQLKPGDVVLDVGCGTGSLALELAPMVREVHAMDVSGEMLKFGKQKALDAKLENITFHQATLEQGLSFPDETFDVVCAFNILHLLDDREGSLARIFDLLKPGGQLISTTPCLGESLIPMKLVISLMRAVGKAPPVSVIKVDQLGTDISAAGFVDMVKTTVSEKKMIAFSSATKPA